MKDLIGHEKRDIEYNCPSYGFIDSLKKTARMHGYQGFLKISIFSIRKLIDYILSMIAYFAPYKGIRILCQKLRGVKIGDGVFLGFHCVFDEIFPDFITIEDNVGLSGNIYILTHSQPFEFYKEKLKSFVAPVIIKKNAWITINVTILPGVTIGEGSLITPGSVVNRDIPDNVIAGGNPAKVIKSLK